MIKLYAKYLKNKVRVTFNVGPNAQAIEPKEYDPGSQLGTINVTTNEGYEFKGWYTTQTFDEGTLVNETYQLDNDITLYAKVELKQYTVTFNVTNGQSIEQKTYNHGTQLGEIIVTPNEGYEFKGWYTETGFTNKVESTYQVESSITLYAKIEIKQYTVTFDVGTNAQPIVQKTYNHGTELGEITVTPNNGYEFKGWYTEASFTNKIENTYQIKSNVTLYAKIELKQYTVTFDVENAQPIENRTYNHGTQLGEIVITPNEGYEFKGWYTDLGFTNKVENTYTVTSNLTLYAKVELKQYTVTFNMGPNAQPIEPKVYNHGTQLGEITVTPNDGYKFKGWYTESTFVTKIENTYQIKSNITLYAKVSDKNLIEDPQDCDYFFISKEDFKSRIGQILEENQNDLSQKTLGFDDSVTDLNEYNGLFPKTIIKAPKMIFARNVIDLSYCFKGCSQLTTIPAGLFDNCTQVNNFNSCFYGCSQLTEIPATLFDKCTQITDFGACFKGCSQLTEIPATLFDKCTQIINFSGCFDTCESLTTIPATLFDKCTQATDFRGCFSYCYALSTIPATLFDKCTQVTDFGACFNGCSQLTEIPATLFDKCTQAISFVNCFDGCESLATIPATLFDKCTQATDFNYCFSFCSSLTEIPATLFDKCTQIINFSGCFDTCESLTTIPATLFDKCTQATDFSYCFSFCSSITSAIPDAWNKEKFANVTDHREYAKDCTKASNYADIPADWK